MEIQLGLRSTEADGRAPGTGRPSTSAPERNATGAALEARRSERVARRESETEHAAFEQRLRERQAQEESRTARKASSTPETEDSTPHEQEPPVERRGTNRSSTGRAEAKPSDAANQPSTTEPRATPSAAAPSPAARATKPAETPLATSTTTTTEAVVGLPLPTLVQPIVAPEQVATHALHDESLALVSTGTTPTVAIPTGASTAAVSVPQMETLLRTEAGQSAEVDPSASAKAQEAARAPARERAADVLRQIGVQLAPQLRQAVIDLYPRELGRIHIRMSVQDGAVRASVRAERPETLESLEQHLPELRALLAGAGLEAQDLSLSLGFDNRRSGGREAHEPFATPAHAELRPATAVELGALARRVANDGGVDTFA